MEQLHFWHCHFFSDLKRKQTSKIKTDTIPFANLFTPPTSTPLMLVVPLKEQKIDWECVHKYTLIRNRKTDGLANAKRNDVAQSRDCGRLIYFVIDCLAFTASLSDYFDIAAREFQIPKEEIIRVHFGIDADTYQKHKDSSFLDGLFALNFPPETRNRLMLAQL